MHSWLIPLRLQSISIQFQTSFLKKRCLWILRESQVNSIHREEWISKEFHVNRIHRAQDFSVFKSGLCESIHTPHESIHSLVFATKTQFWQFYADLTSIFEEGVSEEIIPSQFNITLLIQSIFKQTCIHSQHIRNIPQSS